MDTQDMNPILQQRWMHSHEEDTLTEMVYRPANFAFPPSRGRTGFDLKPDNQLVEVGIAPTDGAREETGTWQLQGGTAPTLSLNPLSSAPRVLPVVSASIDRLVVSK